MVLQNSHFNKCLLPLLKTALHCFALFYVSDFPQGDLSTGRNESQPTQLAVTEGCKESCNTRRLRFIHFY
jgi:hypothetical protein